MGSNFFPVNGVGCRRVTRAMPATSLWPTPRLRNVITKEGVPAPVAGKYVLLDCRGGGASLQQRDVGPPGRAA